MSEKVTVAEKQLVVFTLGEETYGVDIAIVREIIQMQPITQVPGTPYAVEGVINLRGSVIPIVDLRRRFSLEKVTRGKDTRVVVLNCKDHDIGVIVDSVDEVLRISTASIDPPSALVMNGKQTYLSGTVKIQNRLIILLNMEEVLSLESISQGVQDGHTDTLKGDKNGSRERMAAGATAS